MDDEKTDFGLTAKVKRDDGAKGSTPLVKEEWWGKHKHLIRIMALPLLLVMLVVGIVYVKSTHLFPPADDHNDTISVGNNSSGIYEENILPPVIENLLSNMVYVEGGTFMMGATLEQGKDAKHEKPAHQVTLSSFSIGKYEVTQEEWQAVMGSNPSYIKGVKRPVEKVSWDDCQEFIRKLNSMTGKQFRLPTEAEWEYAARGGNKSRGYKYAGSNDIGSVAWYNENSDSRTHDVGQKRPNELGLYDMSGNVLEWCRDWYDDYSDGSQTNPTGSSFGSFRVLRGGGWSYDARDCRVASRISYLPDFCSSYLGLRLVLQ